METEGISQQMQWELEKKDDNIQMDSGKNMWLKVLDFTLCSSFKRNVDKMMYCHQRWQSLACINMCVCVITTPRLLHAQKWKGLMLTYNGGMIVEDDGTWGDG